jgi:hypothetical protein
MNISFTTKEESKKTKEERFLALTPSERPLQFIKSISYFEQFHSKYVRKKMVIS